MPASHSKKDSRKQMLGGGGWGVGVAQIELQQALTSSALSSTHSITYVSSVQFVDAGKNYYVDKG